ncbi:arginine--tRNA ligase [Flavobacterium soli]|uniref:arginine--tRNA ligase n=1 Tax=Flavobacterium soli TaxID=344881 RepID=UPI0003F68203|nr:arginine--tRNA ligase [Flavobacterium soli]
MSLIQTLTPEIQKAIQVVFDTTIEKIEFQATRREFEGDITMVLFPLLKQIKSNPVELGNKIGTYLVENVEEVKAFNVVSGFLNIVISDAYYLNFFNTIKEDKNFGFVTPKENEKAVMVEYSSPNTNKPLHLGHVRNNLLGYSVAEIIKASGKKVYKTQIINDRGIHICKSMLAWEKFGNGETPESTGLKGDKLVGNYYVAFDKEYKEELKEVFKREVATIVNENVSTNNWNDISKGEITNLFFNAINDSLKSFLFKIEVDWSSNAKTNIRVDLPEVFPSYYDKNNIRNINVDQSFELFKRVYVDFFNDFYNSNTENKLRNEDNSSYVEIYKDLKNRIESLQSEKKVIEKVLILKRAQQMLLDWEAGKPEVIALWKKMNQWVYDGFASTYKNLGVDFDSYYYESNTYLLGKDVVQIGLEKGIFEKDPDGSVWIDLTDEGLDRKIVLRSDGTAVYMTQDIGTAIQRVKDFPDVGGMVYTVGNEQDYHFKVLFLILKKLGFDWSKNLFHLSYGMVDLPSGKMKSREGTVVDADDLMNEMTETAKNISEELGKLDDYSDEEKAKLYNTIGLGALKYYILKVDPKKRILFNPEESVDFQGNTGPFIQYTYARIQSIIRKADFDFNGVTFSASEVDLHEKEKELIKQLELYPEVIQNAAQNHSPALIANYTYDLVKEYNSFYQMVPILGSDNTTEKTFRVQLSQKVADTIASAFGLLGISVPERM